MINLYALVNCISNNNPGSLQSLLFCAPDAFPVLRKGRQQLLSQLSLAFTQSLKTPAAQGEETFFGVFFILFFQSLTPPDQFQKLLSRRR